MLPFSGATPQFRGPRLQDCADAVAINFCRVDVVPRGDFFQDRIDRTRRPVVGMNIEIRGGGCLLKIME